MLTIKTKNSEFSMNLPKDASEYLFTVLVMEATKQVGELELVQKPTPIRAEEPPHRDVVLKELASTLVDTNLVRNAIEETQVAYEEVSEAECDEVAIAQRKPEEEKRSRLVVTTCPRCGRRHTIYFTGNRINCTCGHCIDFTDEELVDGSYECPHCNEGHGKFKVLGQIDHISCVKCKGGIMLDYDTESGTFKQVY